jgi:hypothetical protein
MPKKNYDAQPFDFIMDEIKGALVAKLFYSAISLSVALPDYCCTLEGQLPTNWQTYKEWFSKYAAKYFVYFGPHEAYALRCGIVHNARFIGGKMEHTPLSKIVFNLPFAEGGLVHENVMRGKEISLDLDAKQFCELMIAAARDWEDANQENETVKNNLTLLVRYRESDTTHSSGFPVIS